MNEDPDEQLAKVAYEEYKKLLLGSIGKDEYASFMRKWEDMSDFYREVWKGVALRVIGRFMVIQSRSPEEQP